MNNTLTLIAITVVILLIVGGLTAVNFANRQRTKRLQKQFGPEYDRMVEVKGGKAEAEADLNARLKRVKSFNIIPLTGEQAENYMDDWRASQARFVDQPRAALRDADHLIRKVMQARGYPVDHFEQFANDLSVDYPELVVNYRGLHSIAARDADAPVSTEEMRQAMLHGRALFEEILDVDMGEKEDLEKEEHHEL